jgi:hypothetical protein
VERGNEFHAHRSPREPTGHGAQEPVRRIDTGATRRHDPAGAELRESLRECFQHRRRIEQALDVFLAQEQQGHRFISFSQAYQVHRLSLRDETPDRGRHASMEDA